MEGKSSRRPAYYAMDADGHNLLREETEILWPQHVEGGSKDQRSLSLPGNTV
jgi:hypothetical protein